MSWIGVSSLLIIIINSFLSTDPDFDVITCGGGSVTLNHGGELISTDPDFDVITCGGG